MVWLQYGCRDGIGAPKAAIRLDQIASNFAHDAEVVQRVGEVRMERAETGLLHERSLA